MDVVGLEQVVGANTSKSGRRAWAPEPDDWLVPGFAVRRTLGRGATGAVFEVEDTLGKVGALKVLWSTSATSPLARRRFERETKALRVLRHPGVVTVLDAGVSPGGLPWIFMPVLAGSTLRAHLGRGRLSPRDACTYFARVADALACVHALGFVHRDLKPTNLFVGPGLRPCVIDFGIALDLDDEPLTSDSRIVGTPGYLAPEQILGGPVDGRADVYALGACLFESLAGVSPFGRPRDADDLIEAHLERPVPELPREVGATPALQELVAKSLSKRPRQRQPSMLELAVELRAVRRAMGSLPS